MKVLTIVGARPQFIKLAPLSQAVRKCHTEVIVHTGQHFDANMSDIFFNQMGIPSPDVNLEIHGGGHGAQTGEMLMELEKVMLDKKPDWVIVFGDTNSTLAGALSAAKLHIPILHVEAGLRSYDKRMPEEVNRVMTDHVSDILSCPSENAVANLAKEGITKGVVNTGDIMCDAVEFFKPKAQLPKGITDSFILMTIHRPSNADNAQILTQLMDFLGETNESVVFPIHPRTKKNMTKWDVKVPANVQLIEPVGYLEMLGLLSVATQVITDSGGLQKEAFFNKVPCITFRDRTEWVETVETGANQLVLTDSDTVDWDKFGKLIKSFKDFPNLEKLPYGDGAAGERIVSLIR